MFKDSEELLRHLRDNKVAMVDFRFSNLFGGWHHLTLPAARLDDKVLTRGEAFDGSSVGYSKVESGDMALRPDPTTAFIDPFTELPTISVICSVIEADSAKPHPSDPRGICEKAEQHLVRSGFGTESIWGPELEFYIFDRVDHGSETNFAQYRIDSEEAVWNVGGSPDRAARGYTIRRGGGYHACQPQDRLAELRSEAVQILERIGVPVRYHHHEVGGPGQCEIEPLMGPMLKMGDAIMLIKYVVKMVADRRGKTATFMPKPLHGEAGSGLHFHQFFTKKGQPVFHDAQGYAGLSRIAQSYIAGLLDHGPSLLAITNPSTNSYKRLIPGFEAPVNLFYSLGNRSAAIRVPKYAVLPEEKRFEFRPPDATANGYLAMAAMLMAGIDGIKRNLDPGEQGFGPIDENIFNWSEAKRAQIRPLPDSLSSALRALARDHAYLLDGDVFPKQIIDTLIARKSAEAAEIQSRPHPHEFAMYYAV